MIPAELSKVKLERGLKFDQNKKMSLPELQKRVKEGHVLKKPAAAIEAKHTILKRPAAATLEGATTKKLQFTKNGWNVFEHTRGATDTHAGQKYVTFQSPDGKMYRSAKRAVQQDYKV